MPLPYLRTLLASAVVTAAVALAGCNPSDIPTNGRAMAPLSPRMISDIQEKNMAKESPILIRLFKEESELEVWKQTKDGQFSLLKTYPICRWSGDLGPKKKEGDRQAPEGFYTITPGQMNPNSSYYLAFNTGYPNAYDRAWGYTGSELMVHGDCSSRGCYAMTDEQIQEIYALARESFFGGQKSFQLQAYPFRMTALNMARHRNSQHFAFWKMLKEGYDHFEATKLEPKVAVCERRYVFDAASPDPTKPLSFNAKAACPAYELDKNIADAVLDHRRQEQTKMASYIADRVALAAPRHADGGMNPVFADKVGTRDQLDNSGRLVQVVDAPGSLPRVANPPGANSFTPQPQAIANASVPAPASKPKAADEKPKTIASAIGGFFGGSQESDAAEPVALRGSNTDTAAKAKQPAPRAVAAQKPASVPAPAPKTVASTAPASTPAPAPKPQVAQAEQDTPSAPAQQMRSAFSAAPPPANNGLMAGAQPVVPGGTFASRWSAVGLR